MYTKYLFNRLFTNGLRVGGYRVGCSSYNRTVIIMDDRNDIGEILNRINTVKKKLLNVTEEVSQIQTELLRIQGKSPINITRNISTSAKSKRKVPNDVSDTNDGPFGDVKKTKTDFSLNEDGYVIVYTDGACENNGKANAKAGLGVWFGNNHPLNVSEPVKGRATNNCGEIQACTAACKAAQEAFVDKLTIYTDSQFVINSMTKWIHGWKKNNWKTADGKPVKNKDDFVDLIDAMNGLSDVKWKYVPGHSNVEGNEAADELARRGATRYKK